MTRTKLTAETRAGAYARITSDDAKDGLGVERQLEDLRRYCKREGWAIREYVDNDISASTYSKRRRPAFEQMIADVEAGLLDVVLVMELSRYTRNPMVIEKLIQAQDRGVRLVSVQGGEYDVETAQGKMRLRNEASFAASYADFVKDKVKRKKQELREGGNGPGGSRAFGYLGADPDVERQAGTVIDESEAKAYQLAVTDVLNGTSLSAIARRWNDQEFRTPRTGALWGVPSVRVTLLNPRHAGLLAVGVMQGKRHTYDVIGEATWPAIISLAEHKRLTLLLNDPARRKKNPRRRALLTSFVYCSCGNRLRADGAYYRCRILPEIDPRPCGACSFRAETLNEHIESIILEDLGASKPLRRALVKKNKSDAIADDAEHIQNELDELAAAGLPVREYLIARKPLVERLEAAQSQEADRAERSAASALVEEFRGAKDVGSLWASRDLDQKRRIIGLLTSRITVDAGDDLDDLTRISLTPRLP